ncbi:MAG: DUF4382 domain-containing protein [Gemmatimonadetes bacterium]|nr:DUF4382 domain-containing protein [Gemmatimonadota bacterium]
MASPERVFDLLQFQRGSTALLGDVDLAARQYRAIRMTIDPSKSSVVLHDASSANVHWPYAGRMGCRRRTRSSRSRSCRDPAPGS